MYVEFDKGCKYSTKKEPRISDDHNIFSDAGILLEENVVVIDIDEMPIEKLIDYMTVLEIQTQTVFTSRGIHWYFQAPMNFKGSKAMNTTLGCNVEYKHKGNTKAVTVKLNGVMRQIQNEGVFQPLPEWLYPPKTKTSKHTLYEGYLNYTILYGCTKLLKDNGFFNDEYNWTRYIWAIGTLHTDDIMSLKQAYELCQLIDDGCKQSINKLMYGLNRYHVSFGFIHRACISNEIPYIKLIRTEDK